MEQCESAAALLESVREQEVQFEQLTRALEEERRRVGLSATSPSALGRPLPHTQVKMTTSKILVRSLCLHVTTIKSSIKYLYHRLLIIIINALVFPTDLSHPVNLL